MIWGRRTIVAISVVAALLVAAAGVLVWRTTAEVADAGTTGTTGTSAPPHEGRFVVECRFSHSAADDPIVFPDQPGESHLHDFFGHTGVDASTTAADLRHGDTTCRTKQDRASYWAPALFDGDRKIDPTSSDAYYRAAPGVDPSTVQPFPFGLEMIAGDHGATTEQDTAIVGWTCGPNPRRHPTPPRCKRGSPLRVRVTFPDCWDGEHLDSDDHVSHMARSGPDGCPDDHPVAVPQLEFVIEYPFWGDPSDLRLSSGPTVGAHADFIDGWEQQKISDEVRLCINADVVCGVPQLGPFG